MVSWFSDAYEKIIGMKKTTEQQDIMNKINDTYESISKGLEDLNVKVNNIKDLKKKLESLPPPQEKPKETSDNEIKKDDTSKGSSSGSSSSSSSGSSAPVAEPPKPLFGPTAVSTTESSSSTQEQGNTGVNAIPQQIRQEASSSPLPIPGAVSTPSPSGEIGNIESVNLDGGKKRKTRAKGKRGITKNNKNGERKKRQRTRKIKNNDNNNNNNKGMNDAEANSESAS